MSQKEKKGTSPAANTETTPTTAAPVGALANCEVGDTIYHSGLDEMLVITEINPDDLYPIKFGAKASCTFLGEEHAHSGDLVFMIPVKRSVETESTEHETTPESNEQNRLPDLLPGSVIWDAHNDTPVMVEPRTKDDLGMFHAGFPYKLSNGDYCTASGYHHDGGNLQQPGEEPRYRLANNLGDEIEQYEAFKKDKDAEKSEPQKEDGDDGGFGKVLAGILASSLVSSLKAKKDTPKEGLPAAQVVNFNTTYKKGVNFTFHVNIEVHI